MLVSDTAGEKRQFNLIDTTYRGGYAFSGATHCGPDVKPEPQTIMQFVDSRDVDSEPMPNAGELQGMEVHRLSRSALEGVLYDGGALVLASIHSDCIALFTEEDTASITSEEG